MRTIYLHKRKAPACIEWPDSGLKSSPHRGNLHYKRMYFLSLEEMRRYWRFNQYQKL